MKKSIQSLADAHSKACLALSQADISGIALSSSPRVRALYEVIKITAELADAEYMAAYNANKAASLKLILAEAKQRRATA